MKPLSLIEKQIDGRMEKNRILPFDLTQSFKKFLDVLKGGGDVISQLRVLFQDVHYLGQNLFLFEEFCNEILLYLDDNEKAEILDLLYNLFFSRQCYQYRDKILDVFLSIIKKMSDIDLRKQYAALSSHLLGENPCSIDWREKVLEVLRMDIPDFKFDDDN